MVFHQLLPSKQEEEEEAFEVKTDKEVNRGNGSGCQGSGKRYTSACSSLTLPSGKSNKDQREEQLENKHVNWKHLFHEPPPPPPFKHTHTLLHF